MEPPFDHRRGATPLNRWPRRAVVAAGVYALVTGVVTLIGWGADLPRLADWDGDRIPMFPNTAVCAALCGAALLLTGGAFRRVAAGLGLVAGTVGGLTLFQHISGADLKIDTLLFEPRFEVKVAASPMRMGPPASFCFIIMGAMLALVALRARGAHAAWIGGAAVAAVAMLSLMGYIYRADPLYTIPHLTTIAMQTSTALLMLGLGLIAAVPNAGPARALAGDSGASQMLRRVLPALVLLPVVLSWARVRGQEMGYYDLAFGIALRTLFEMALLLALAWWAAAAVRRHEARLEHSNRRLQGLLGSITEGFQTLDSGMRFTAHNAAKRRLLAEHGIDPDATLGRNIFEVFPALADTQAGAALRRCMEERVEVAFDVHYEPWDRWFALRGSPTPDGGISILSLDITERKQAEARLHENQRQLAAKLDASKRLQAISSTLVGPDMVEKLYAEIVDAARAIMGSQCASLQIIHPGPEHAGELRLIAYRGFTPEAAQAWEWVSPASDTVCALALAEGAAVLVPDVRECEAFKGKRALEQYAAAGVRTVQSTPLRSRSGEMLGMLSVYWSEPYDPDETARGAMEVLARQAADLIERTRHQNELEQLVEARTAEAERAQAAQRRAERLAAMGTLTAGLGHDLSNMLLPLRMRLEVLERMDARPEVREEIKAVKTGLNYLQQLVNGLRQLAANPDSPPPPEGTNLSAWWAEFAGIFKALLPRGTRLECDIAPGLPAVNTAAGPLSQAVFNLVQNAAEALAHAPQKAAEGVIRVAAAPGAARQGWVELTVADNGPGMSQETMDRCFEPYFSTKGRAVSTGMGLSLVRGIVQAAGGSIECASAPGRGTTFTLHLPPARAAAAPGQAAAVPGGSRVTAVLDIAEPRIAMLIQAVLRSFEVEVKPGSGTIPVDADLWITDQHPRADIMTYIEGSAAGAGSDGSPAAVRRAVVVGQGADISAQSGLAIHTGQSPSTAALRAAIERAVRHI